MTAAIRPAGTLPRPSLDQLRHFLRDQFPQSPCELESLAPMGATVRHRVGPGELRPGGTVSGPVMMFTADVALYAAILGEIGIVPLAVTTSLTFNFLRKPAGDRDIIGVCELVKLGKSLAVGEVKLFSDGLPELVAHAVGTYAIPKK
jgi:acyl-coenzyme A thioesterase PaaI-like protein